MQRDGLSYGRFHIDSLLLLFSRKIHPTLCFPVISPGLDKAQFDSGEYSIAFLGSGEKRLSVVFQEIVATVC